MTEGTGAPGQARKAADNAQETKPAQPQQNKPAPAGVQAGAQAGGQAKPAKPGNQAQQGQGAQKPEANKADANKPAQGTPENKKPKPLVAVVPDPPSGGGAPAPKVANPQNPQPKKGPAGPTANKPGTAKPTPAKPNQGKQPGNAKPVKPTANRTRMRKRHWGLVMSFVWLVFAPMLVVTYYLWMIATDQYSSVTGFTVRKEEGGNASELLGGLSQFAGSGGASDGEILYEFILSQSLVRAVEEETGLVAHYSAHWDQDPVFALWPEPSIEDLEWFWQRIVRVAFDSGSGLIEVQVLAFDPDMAQQVSEVIVRKSQEMINALNEQAREDSMRYARVDLDEAVNRLKTAREALTAFRTRTQIVDPEADIQGRLGVMNNLQQQLAEALIEYDLLRGTTNSDDPRLVQERRRITVIRERIANERLSFATSGPSGGQGDELDGAVGEDYPSLIAEFEGLVVDREFAEETYRASLTALDLARAKAQRQSRYLATYVRPTLAESSEYPRRITIVSLVGLFLLLSWAVMVLIFYSIRDRA